MGGEKKATAAAAGKRLIFRNIYIYKRCNVTRVCSEPALPASLDFSLPRTLVIILYCWPGLFISLEIFGRNRAEGLDQLHSMTYRFLCWLRSFQKEKKKKKKEIG
jgi:hypothetical protein